MRINRNKLVSDLSRALPGISVGTVKIEGADTFVFKDNHIYTYNSTISVDVIGTEEYGLEGVVSAKEFYDCLAKLPSEEIDVISNEKTWEITDGKIKVTLNLVDIPNIFERFASISPKDDGWKEIKFDDLKKAISICSIPHNSTKFSGLLFNGNNVYSTNQSEINRYELSSEYPTFMISEAAALELLKHDNLTHVQFNKHWVQFLSSENVVFSVREMNKEVFPLDLVKGLLEKVADKPVYTTCKLSDKFFVALSRALAFSNDIDGVKTVSVTFGDEVKVSSMRNSGSYEESVDDMKVDCEPFTIDLDVELFLRTNGVFESLDILGDITPGESKQAVHILFKNGGSVKLCSSVTE